MKAIVLTGGTASGKSTLAAMLCEQLPGSCILKTIDLLKASSMQTKTATAAENARDASRLGSHGDAIDRVTEGMWLVEAAKKLQPLPIGYIVVDAVRSKAQLSAMRQHFSVLHVALFANEHVRHRRFDARSRHDLDNENFERRERTGQKLTNQSLASVADASIDTTRDTPVSTLSRVLPLICKATHQIHVIIGGQWGSEGKGQIAAHLAREHEYGVAVRSGGPNAGHSVMANGEKCVFHHLPSATVVGDCLLALGPGCVINKEVLFKELDENRVYSAEDRLRIDPRCAIVTHGDVGLEGGVGNVRDRIGSTAQGVGQAAARRMADRGRFGHIALHHKDLTRFICDVPALIATTLRGSPVQVEGTQGFGLSMSHGDYPYVTSRDTSIFGIMADAGAPMTNNMRRFLVFRSYPIRVQSPEGGTSGPMGNEIDWTTIADRSGIDIEELVGCEMTTTTKRRRRVAEFCWDQFVRSCRINGATDICLTFADYHCVATKKAQKWEDLTPHTIDMIVEMERLSGVPVTMVACRFSEDAVLNRKWQELDHHIGSPLDIASTA